MATGASGRDKAEAKPAPQATHSGPADRIATTDAKSGKTAMVDRRTRILQIATRRFAEFGFEATTVRQIADDVNVLSGSLYHHFATKDEMLHEIVRDVVLTMRDNTRRIAQAPVDAEHRLVALILLDLGELTRNQEVHSILYNERKFFRRKEEFSYVVQAKKDAYEAWKAVLADGVKSKLFKANLDIYLTISTVLRMLNAAADWYKNEDSSVATSMGAYTLDQVTDFYLDFILSTVRTPARASDPVPRQACEDLATFQA